MKNEGDALLHKGESPEDMYLVDSKALKGRGLVFVNLKLNAFCSATYVTYLSSHFAPLS